ncbi:hypothetical protein DWY99_10520 [[Clostridium] leptum]|uniref:Uncharacterized protein n=1 Tax=[Clostridium] leptum TaxID=1535 RepID=A0A412AVU7_9FIRM|nr:hypothetical protein DWY99_10520 [[Clostridium] leptum]
MVFILDNLSGSYYIFIRDFSAFIGWSALPASEKFLPGKTQADGAESLFAFLKNKAPLPAGKIR